MLMLTANDMFRLMVSLAEVGDSAAFEIAAKQHPSTISHSIAAAFHDTALDFERLIDDYDYLESPQFLELVQTKNATVAEMLRKLANDPMRRKEHRQKLVEALQSLPEDRTAFELVAERHHEILERALAALDEARKYA